MALYLGSNRKQKINIINKIINYKDFENITYNESDNTITLIERDGTEHTILCTYENDMLIFASYDGEEINLGYENDDLVSIGGTVIDLSKSNLSNSVVTSLDHTVTFLADGKPYEVVSVTDGNTVNAPSGIPTSTNGKFTGWKLNGGTVTFPHAPETDDEIEAVFQTVRSEISTDKAGVNLGTVLGEKTNNGLCICAYGYQNASNPNAWNDYYIVGKKEESIRTSKITKSTGTFDYEGETWYYGKTQKYGEPIIDGNIEFYFMGESGVASVSLPKVLDYYFIK